MVARGVGEGEEGRGKWSVRGELRVELCDIALTTIPSQVTSLLLQHICNTCMHSSGRQHLSMGHYLVCCL